MEAPREGRRSECTTRVKLLLGATLRYAAPPMRSVFELARQNSWATVFKFWSFLIDQNVEGLFELFDQNFKNFELFDQNFETDFETSFTQKL